MNFNFPPIKRTLSCLSLMIILMISVSCEMPAEDETSSDASSKELPGANYGYANSGFLYFYYPQDKKIYYMSGNAIHKMYINGTHSTVVKSDLWENPNSLPSYPFIYVSNGTVYYNDRRRDNTTYKMKTDGTEHATWAVGKIGPMGGLHKTENKTVLYFDDKQQYLKENTRYFSKDRFDNLSKQTLADDGSTTSLTNMQADNFVFSPEGIYFRLRAAASGLSAYGIVKVSYDAESEGTGNAARLKNTDMRKVVDPSANITHQASEPTTWVSLNRLGESSRINSYQFNTLNVSKDFIAYIGRSIDIDGDESNLLPGGLNVVHRGPDRYNDRYNAPQTVRVGLNKFNLAGGGVNIIGDYMYWLTHDRDHQRYKLHRVKKDGKGYRVVKSIPY